MEIAGRVLSEYMQKLLLEAGHSFTGSSNFEIVKSIKESLSFVAGDYEAVKSECETSNVHDHDYTLPDKQVIIVPGTVRIMCPELLFKPELNGKTCKSIQDLTHSCVKESDIDVRKDLLKNVIMSGGSTMYEGMADRLKSELTTLSPAGSDIRIIASADRKFAVWKGASTLASLSSFGSSWMSAADYGEYGAANIHKKCS